MTLDNTTQIGKIVKTHGIDNALVVALEQEVSFAQPAEFLFIELHNLKVPFRLLGVNEIADTTLIVRLDCKHIERKTLVGCDVFVATKTIESLGTDDENPIIGFEVYDSERGLLGTVEEVLEIPDNVLLQVRSGKKEYLIPANENIVINIDDEKRRIDINAPEGLLDLE